LGGWPDLGGGVSPRPSDVIPLAEARRQVLEAVGPLAPVRVALVQALGCVTAGDIVAAETVPSFANSSMDGFALRAADTIGAPVTLRVVATTLAGMGPSELGAGQAVRLMTGAPLPAGADAVCMLERTAGGAGPDEVRVLDRVDRGNFVRQPGDDIRPGDVVVPGGTGLRPGHLGVLGSLGESTVRVHPRPHVGVLSTGDELTAPGEPLGPGRIRDANGPSLMALVRASGCTAVDLGTTADDVGAIVAAVGQGVGCCDAFVVSGGVSVGDADVVKAALQELCGDSARWLQVAIKPAKPLAFGVLASSAPLFGLPGNPVSAMVSFELFARPALMTMAGEREVDHPVAVGVADEDLARPADGKIHFLRVEAAYGDDGLLHARPSGAQQSHVLTAMAAANALAVVPDGDGVRRGERVHLLLLRPDDVAGSPDTTAALPW